MAPFIFPQFDIWLAVSAHYVMKMCYSVYFKNSVKCFAQIMCVYLLVFNLAVALQLFIYLY